MNDRKDPSISALWIGRFKNSMAQLLLAAALFLGLFGGGAALAQTFLPGFEDVPLMEGLAAEQDAGLVFDSPAGRIVEAYAVGEVAWQDVITFYTATLQSLGWRTLGQGRFAREGEELHIDRFGRDGDLTVRFTLAPG